LWIVVVADACTDATAKAARGALGAFGEVLEIAARCHQTADRIGVSAVMDHYHQIPRHALLLASMDAGTNLRRDWFDIKDVNHIRKGAPLLYRAAGAGPPYRDGSHQGGQTKNQPAHHHRSQHRISAQSA
jgi:hypothetical protein